METTASLSNSEGDGYENVTLNWSEVALPSRSIRQILAVFSGVEFQKTVSKVQDKKMKAVVLRSRPPQNVKIDIFMS